MQELVQHLCRIIVEQLQAQPQMLTDDLVTAVWAQIVGDDRLNKEIESQSRTIQINTGNATGHQTTILDSIVNCHVNEDVARSAIELILKRLGLVSVGIPNNINRSGSEHFVGRDGELQELDRMLQTSRQVAVTAVQGMGGVGKTELALQYALEQLKAETHSGGVCWLRGREDVGGQIELFAQTQLGLRIPEELKNEDLSARVAYYWRHWGEGEVLVVVDDVLDYEAIQGYLPPVDGLDRRFKVLLTTRLELGSGIQRLPLGVLELEAAVALVRGLIGAKRVDAELDDAKSLCEWLGRLPLGIELVGRYLARNQTLTLAKMQERLNYKRFAARGLIKHDVAMTATHQSLAVAFEVSWEDLGNGAVFKAPIGEYARQLGALLSLFAVAPIVWKWVVDCLPEWDEDDLDAARDYGLISSHLLQVNGDNTYQLHPMVREFLAVKCDEMLVKEKFQQILQDVIWGAAERSSKNPEKSLILECNYVVPHLQEQIQQSEVTGTKEDTASGLNNIGFLYYAMGKFIDAEPLFVRSLAIREQQLGSDHPDIASSLHDLAQLYRVMGKYSQSEPLYVRSLSICEQKLGANHRDTAAALNNVANFYRRRGRYNEIFEISYHQRTATRS
jgi:tetratricopeptide (TPR) repeat protein